MEKGNKATIIYLDDCILLSKKRYRSWKECQDKYYEKYKANLAPMTCDEIISFFEEDFGQEENWPFTRKEIIDFFNSEEIIKQSKGEVGGKS